MTAAQRTRLLTILLGVPVLLASQSVTVASAQSGVTDCSASVLQFSLSAQETATQSAIFLSLRNRGRRTCRAVGLARFEIDRAGRRAHVIGNPLTAHVDVTLHARRLQLAAHVWWANWCGARRELVVSVRFVGDVTHSPLRALPACLSPTRRSTLRLPAARHAAIAATR